MEQITYKVVSPETVWLEYTKNGDKHVKELVGKEAVQFLRTIEDGPPMGELIAKAKANGE